MGSDAGSSVRTREKVLKMYTVFGAEPAQVGRAGSSADRFDHLLDIKGVARNLGVGERTVERMIARGEFPPADFRLRRLVRWRTSTVEAWMDAVAPHQDAGACVQGSTRQARSGRGKRGVA